MAPRPVGRTSCSLKRMLIPWLVTRMISFVPSVVFTSISSSSSCKPIAIRPVFLMFLKADITVFFTVPFFVTIMRLSSSLNSLIGITDVTFSPGTRFSRLIIAVPRAVLPASGISYAFMQNALPRLVKNII